MFWGVCIQTAQSALLISLYFRVTRRTWRTQAQSSLWTPSSIVTALSVMFLLLKIFRSHYINLRVWKWKHLWHSSKNVSWELKDMKSIYLMAKSIMYCHYLIDNLLFHIMLSLPFIYEKIHYKEFSKNLSTGRKHLSICAWHMQT